MNWPLTQFDTFITNFIIVLRVNSRPINLFPPANPNYITRKSYIIKY